MTGDKKVNQSPSKTRLATNNHIRRKSSLEGINPLDDPEIYYGPKTDPSKYKPGSHSTAGRTRTMSAILPKINYGYNLPPPKLEPITSQSPSPPIERSANASPVHNGSSSSVVFSLGSGNGSGKKGKGKNLADEVRKRLLIDKGNQTSLDSRQSSESPFDSNDESSDSSDDESDYSQDSEFSSNGFKFRTPKSTSNLSVGNKEHSKEPEVGPMSNSVSIDSSISAVSPSRSTSSLVQMLDNKVVNPIDVGSKDKVIGVPLTRANTDVETSNIIRRRLSIDNAASFNRNRRFFIANIKETLDELLAREDTDSNYQITIEDTGPKVLKLGTANSNGYNQFAIRGTYMLSNLLQELTIAQRLGRNQVILDEERLNENPVSRLTRLIKTQFWKKLKRQITKETIAEIALDTKIKTPEAEFPRIYIPYDKADQYKYFTGLSKENPSLNLQVEYLPKEITPKYVRSINHKPGLLTLAMKEFKDPTTCEIKGMEGYPYIVPGGRFNEQYGWDSYMETLGLILSDDKSNNYIESGIGMCENFIFEIENYGKILNANRSYYLCRSQPPFLTDMALKIYEYFEKNPVRYQEFLKQINFHFDKEDFLKRSILAAIKEYEKVWMSSPRLDPKTGLSCYHPDGMGIPPETESTHFESLLKPYIKKYNCSCSKEFEKMYNEDQVDEPELDRYLLHDRAVRESGHDTSYRLEGICADLATVDLNSLLYKYEIDIATTIKEKFNNDLEGHKSEDWFEKSEIRKSRVDKYLWNEEKGMYFDYNIKKEEQISYESVTTFWPMWSKMASSEQASRLISNLDSFEENGGLVAGTLRSRGSVGLDRPARQWDYPYGWAPHQIIAWQGFKNYNYFNIARRLSYRWLYLMTLAFVDFNGIVVEKYDVTSKVNPHKVDAEYGNQGSGFKGVALEGFGWVNASYLVGLNNLDRLGVRALGMVTSPSVFFKNMNSNDKADYGLD